MRNVLVSFNDYVCDWHVCLSVKFWQKYICSDATRPPLKIGKNFIFPRKTLENNFFRVQPGHIYHICGREEGFSAPPSFKLSLYPALPPPPPYPFPEEYDANIRQGRTEDLFFLFKLGCFNFTPHFFIRFNWWVIESNKSIFSVLKKDNIQCFLWCVFVLNKHRYVIWFNIWKMNHSVNGDWQKSQAWEMPRHRFWISATDI